MDSLPTSMKPERRGRSRPLPTSSPSIVMAFFSCLAWLYVAGRLWEDAENRTLLTGLLKKNLDQRPKVLSVEDKLAVLGCKDLERRIVEAEMELTLAKSQGFLKNKMQKSSSSSGQKLLAVIGVYTGFGSRLKRNMFRGSWMPRGDALKKLEERGVVIRFVIGRSANRGDSLDRNIDEENRTTKDILILEGHEEAQEELPKKAKIFFSTAIQMWDAEFYVKVDDNINLDLEGLVELLDRRRGHDGAYIGCMKSGDVISEEGKPWYEPEWWKFGDEKSYFRHASGSLFILSKNLAQYININSASLKTYAHDDTSVGSWMMGIQSTFIDDSHLCCSSTAQDKEEMKHDAGSIQSFCRGIIICSSLILKEGLIHLARAIKFGFPRTVFSSNQLIHLYSKSGQLTEAQKLFDEMPVRNVFSWNAIISAHVKGRDFEQANRLFEAATERDLVTYNSMLSGYISAVGHEMDAVELFMEMQSVHGSVKPDEFTLTIMLNLSAKICSVSFGRQLHSYMVKTGNDLNGFATSSLIDMYSKNESFGDALKVFSQVDQGVDLVSRNAMLAACCREGDLGLASDLFWREARLNDVISWNTLISAFTQNGLAEESVKMFVEMEKNGIRWSEHTFAGLLDACSTLKDVKLGKEIHGWVLKNGMISNPFLSSGLIDVYCKCGNMKYAESVYATGDVKNPFLITRMITGYSSSGSMPRARQLFDVLTEKNSVVWTALFCGYVKAQQCEAVFELLHEYRKEEQKEVLDPLIIVSLLGACALQSGLAPGKQAHSYMLRRGIKIDEKLASALIDMYCKSGNIGHAEKIFDRLIERDIVHYNIMIAGYAHSGHGDRAIELYHEMLEKSLRPDSVTFLALLSACRHCGLVELGEQYFHSLTSEHDVLPEIDHYCCMIDLYGRTNCLEKAIDFMKTIPSNMDAAIFGAFLSACKLNGKLQMVREVEEKLLTMEEGNGSRYIQLANLYAEHGHWDEMERIRRKMRGKEAKKLAGCSWLYVEDLVHVFTSGDTTHMKSDAIYSTLGFLTGELLEMADMGTEDCEGMRSMALEEENNSNFILLLANQ